MIILQRCLKTNAKMQTNREPVAMTKKIPLKNSILKILFFIELL